LRFPDRRKVGSSSSGRGDQQRKVWEWSESGSGGRRGGSPYITPPLGVHILVRRVKLDIGEVDLVDASRSSWIGTVKLLD
jgi:hypothetical protein